MSNEIYYELINKIFDHYGIQSIYESKWDKEAFVNQVFAASDGDITRQALRLWIKRHGLEYVFQKVVYVFAMGMPYGAYLNKAIEKNW